MRDNRMQYQHVVEDQMELVCRYLPDCTLTFANQAYCRYHELLGRFDVIIRPKNHPEEFQINTPGGANLQYD